MIIQRTPQSMVACALFFSLTSIVACGAGGDAGSDRSMASLSLSPSASPSVSPSPGLYDSNGNILQPAEDSWSRHRTHGRLQGNDLEKTDRTFIFEEVNGTKCELVLTRQGEGLETQYIAALQLADGSGFGFERSGHEKQSTVRAGTH